MEDGVNDDLHEAIVLLAKRLAAAPPDMPAPTVLRAEEIRPGWTVIWWSNGGISGLPTEDADEILEGQKSEP